MEKHYMIESSASSRNSFNFVDDFNYVPSNTHRRTQTHTHPLCV